MKISVIMNFLKSAKYGRKQNKNLPQDDEKQRVIKYGKSYCKIWKNKMASKIKTIL